MTLIEKADCLRSELNARIPGAAAALAGLKKKGVVELLDVVADRLKTVEADPDKTPSTLSKSQSAALADINAAFENTTCACFMVSRRAERRRCTPNSSTTLWPQGSRCYISSLKSPSPPN